MVKMTIRNVLDRVRTKTNHLHRYRSQPVEAWSNQGYCTTCTSEVTFIAKHTWLRDHYVCSNCGSIPRERALMHVLDTWYPDWPQLRIHESSPGRRGASIRLARECRSYIPSQFFPDVPLGQSKDQMRCENLEALSFPDELLDLQISQDVMEHVLNPERAFREIARALKPGGAHVFTVPLASTWTRCRVRAGARMAVWNICWNRGITAIRSATRGRWWLPTGDMTSAISSIAYPV